MESSAAIAGGAVYVGAATGEVLAIDMQTGKLRWKYKAGEGIGESSPAVRERRRLYRGSRWDDTRRQRRRWQAAMDIEDGRRDQIVASGGIRQRC